MKVLQVNLFSGKKAYDLVFLTNPHILRQEQKHVWTDIPGEKIMWHAILKQNLKGDVFGFA